MSCWWGSSLCVECQTSKTTARLYVRKKTQFSSRRGDTTPDSRSSMKDEIGILALAIEKEHRKEEHNVLRFFLSFVSFCLPFLSFLSCLPLTERAEKDRSSTGLSVSERLTAGKSPRQPVALRYDNRPTRRTMNMVQPTRLTNKTKVGFSLGLSLVGSTWCCLVVVLLFWDHGHFGLHCLKGVITGIK